MNRRGFLQSILAAGVAPAFVGSSVLMPVRSILLPTWDNIRTTFLPPHSSLSDPLGQYAWYGVKGMWKGVEYGACYPIVAYPTTTECDMNIMASLVDRFKGINPSALIPQNPNL